MERGQRIGRGSSSHTLSSPFTWHLVFSHVGRSSRELRNVLVTFLGNTNYVQAIGGQCLTHTTDFKQEKNLGALQTRPQGDTSLYF